MQQLAKVVEVVEVVEVEQVAQVVELSVAELTQVSGGGAFDDANSGGAGYLSR